MNAPHGILLTMAVLAVACGDGDELSFLRGDAGDGGLPLIDDGSVPDIDGGDGAVDIDANLQDAEAGADAETVDSAIEVPDGAIWADGGCPSGYAQTGLFCFDIDECAPGGTATCQAPSGYCTNTPGSFTCTCVLGKELVGGVCTDIDECARDLDECGAATCTNIDGPGRYRCGDCPAGTLPDANNVCVNVNECTFPNACLPGTACTDRTPDADASTPTLYECTCPTGYSGGVNGVCNDVDECNNNAANCTANSTCNNSVGSFSCDCNTGYVASTSGGVATCINIDECATGQDGCDPRQACVDSVGSYSCGACPAGYDADPFDAKVCIDVDECDPSNNPCTDPALPLCTNTYGGYTCVASCDAAFGTVQGTGPRAQICENIKECDDALTFTCGSGATCTDRLPPLKYECSCPPGTVGDPDPISGCLAATATPTLTGGYTHTCAVLPDQTIRCWGSTADGATTPRDRTTTPPTALAGNFTQVVNGRNFSCALRADGHVFCWGLNTEGQAPPSPGGLFTQLTATEANVCGIREDRSVYCWGRNTTQQNVAPAGVYRSISGGTSHLCGIDLDRDVSCWGTSNMDRLNAPSRNDYSAVSAGAEHTCAITPSNAPAPHLLCWGSNLRGQTTLPSNPEFVEISAGAYHTCGLRADQTVACWGYDDPAIAGNRLTPPSNTTFFSIAAGQTYTCGLTTTFAYVCWGEMADNQGVPPP